jgi:hypothetical protein
LRKALPERALVSVLGTELSPALIAAEFESAVSLIPEAAGYAWEHLLAGAVLIASAKNGGIPRRLAQVLEEAAAFPDGFLIPACGEYLVKRLSQQVSGWALHFWALSTVIDAMELGDSKLLVAIHTWAGADMAWIAQDAAGAKVLVAVQCRTGTDADLLESLRTVDPALQFTTKTQRADMLAGRLPTRSKSMGFLREDYEKWQNAFKTAVSGVVRVVANAPGFTPETVAMINRWNAAVPDSPILLVQAARPTRRLPPPTPMSPPSAADLAARGAFLFPQRSALTTLRCPTAAFVQHLLTGAAVGDPVFEERDLHATRKRSRAGRHTEEEGEDDGGDEDVDEDEDEEGKEASEDTRSAASAAAAALFQGAAVAERVQPAAKERKREGSSRAGSHDTAEDDDVEVRAESSSSSSSAAANRRGSTLTDKGGWK